MLHELSICSERMNADQDKNFNRCGFVDVNAKPFECTLLQTNDVIHIPKPCNFKEVTQSGLLWFQITGQHKPQTSSENTLSEAVNLDAPCSLFHEIRTGECNSENWASFCKKHQISTFCTNEKKLSHQKCRTVSE
jgi:hypothetical protein